jgi:hypothetical protein
VFAAAKAVASAPRSDVVDEADQRIELRLRQLKGGHPAPHSRLCRAHPPFQLRVDLLIGDPSLQFSAVQGPL